MPMSLSLPQMIRRLLAGYLAAAVVAAGAYQAGADDQADGKTDDKGFQELFDGQTLKGWTQRGGTATYSVEDGAIVGASKPKTANSFLCTEQEFANFELELEFQVDEGLNSGVQIRSESRPDYQNGRVHGYQVEIDPSARAWTAGIYDEGRRGWLVNLEKNEAARKAFRHGQWNQLRVVCDGPSIKT
jgi:hypothetical protein